MQKEAGLADEYHSPAFETEVIRGMKGMTIGVDLEDRTSRDCVIVSIGEMVSEGVATTRIAMRAKFGGLGRFRIALEVATHSRLLAQPGREVIVVKMRR